MTFDLSIANWHVLVIAWSLVYNMSIISYGVVANEKDLSFLDLKKTWLEQGHNLTQYLSDENIEIYHDGDASFRYSTGYPIGDFKSAKQLYNATFFGKDTKTKIYVILHKTCINHTAEIHSNMSIGLLNVVHCSGIPTWVIDACYWNSVFREKYHSDYFIQNSGFLFNHLLDILLNYFISPSSESEAEEIPKHLLSDWKIVDLLRHYTRLEVGYFGSPNLHKNFGEYPQQKIHLFTRWYEIIYNKYGKGQVVRDFLELIKNASEKDASLRNRAIPPGEFVHFWSSAVKVDLRYFAFMSFGWTNEYDEQFEIARKMFPYFNYAESFNSYTRLPPLSRCIKEYSNVFDDPVKDCQERIHMEKQVAFSTDRNLSSTLFLFKPIAQAWSYVTDTYGPSGLDPYLYFKLTYNDNNVQHVCSLNRDLRSYLPKIDDEHQFARFLTTEKSNEHFHEIECPLNKKNIETTTDETNQVEMLNLPEMLRLIATNALATSKETGNWPPRNISEDAAVDVVTYDILIALGRTQDANEWAKVHFEGTVDSPRANTFWMRDWLLPLYTHFHGSRALTAFIEQLSAHWPKQGTDYTHQLNVGQFVHFSSAAVNKDLRDLAEKTFGWKETFQQQFEQARSKFQDYNYTDTYVNFNNATFSPPLPWKENWFGHREKLILVKSENDVAFYQEININTKDFPSWVIELMSDAWLHVKEAYGPFSDDPNLHVILHEEKQEGCVTSTLESTFNQRSVLDCSFNSSLGWDVESPVTKDLLVQGLASLVLGSLKWTGPSGRLFRNNDWRWDFFGILVYDIYSSLNNTLDLGRWAEKRKEGDVRDAKLLFGEKHPMFGDQVVGTGDSTQRKMHLFQNWMLPLYTKYGGTKVLQNFLRILKENLPQQQQHESGFEKLMSLGEFVHFWSGAVGVNLESFAKQSFGMGTQMYRSIDRARRKYPRISYSDESDKKEMPKSKPKASKGYYKSERDLLTGISIPVFLVVFFLIVIQYLRERRKFNILKADYRKLTPSELQDFFVGAPRAANAQGNALIESEPFNRKYEIDKGLLEFDSGIILGSGEYGVVLKARLKLITSPIKIPVEYVTVAVKTPKPDVDVATFKALLSELKVMGHIGKHENVIQLFGAVTANIQKRELFVALEFCSKRDLLSFIRKNREDFQDLLKNSDANLPLTETAEIELPQLPLSPINYENLNNEFSTLDLLEWSRQIANGMNFIGYKNIIHGDLAARNVLLTADRVAKISDFGLSRQLVNYLNYSKKSDTPMPWRWMALESLLEMKFSASSDVWAFGVTLFEIFSLGSIPYPGGNWTHEFVDQLSSGYRLSAPKYGNQDIHELMQNCMKKEAKERPDFSAITSKLQNLKAELFPQSLVARSNCTYVDINV